MKTSYTSFDPLLTAFTQLYVHLHGSIGGLNRRHVLDQLVPRESYLAVYNQVAMYTQFQGDIKSHQFIHNRIQPFRLPHFCTIIGKVLCLPSELFYSITRPDAVFVRRPVTRLSVFIGSEGFASLLRRFTFEATVDVTRLKKLSCTRSLRDKRACTTTAIEKLNLLVYGTFNYSRCAATLPSELCYLPRG